MTRMSIEETLALAERFWIGSGYMQHLHPNKNAYLQRVLALLLVKEAVARKAMQRENGAEAKAQTA